MQEGGKKLGESGCWQEPPGVKGLALRTGVQRPSLHGHPAAEPRPSPFPSQACFSVKCARAQEGKLSGESNDSENI